MPVEASEAADLAVGVEGYRKTSVHRKKRKKNHAENSGGMQFRSTDRFRAKSLDQNTTEKEPGLPQYFRYSFFGYPEWPSEKKGVTGFSGGLPGPP